MTDEPEKPESQRLRALRLANEAKSALKKGRGKTLTEARIRKATADADRAELDTEELKGKLIRKNLVADALQRLVTNAGTKLNGLGTKLASQLVGLSASEIKDAIDKAVTEALTELNEFSFADEQQPRKGRGQPRRPRRDPPPLAGKAQANRQRVGGSI
jgi:hypothetical protein